MNRLRTLLRALRHLLTRPPRPTPIVVHIGATEEFAAELHANREGFLTDAEAEAAARSAVDAARLAALGRILHRQLARVEREARKALGVTTTDLTYNADGLWAILRTGTCTLAGVS